MVDSEKEVERLVKLRFIGGRGRMRPPGPWVNHSFGAVYVKRSRFMDQESYPYWEYVDEMTEDELELYGVDEEIPMEPMTGTTEEGVNIELTTPTQSVGLTKSYGRLTPDGRIVSQPTETDRDIYESMSDDQLKSFISGHGIKVDGRWGRESLIREALKFS